MPIIPDPTACQVCGGGGSGESGADVESLLLCDIDPSNGEVVGTAIAVYAYDDAGVPTGPPTFVIPGTNDPYVVQFMLQPCDSEGQSSVVELCDVDPLTNSSVQFIRHYIFAPDGSVASFHDSLPDGSIYVPVNDVVDCNPYTTCTPQAGINLNADCGPGEAPNGVLIQDEPGVATDSVVDDDPTADALCGGVWDRPSQAAAFSVNETFRNATFDQPGPVIQGTAPYAGLTASAGWTGSNVDPDGDGWLQTSDINSGTNGVWQVPNPFTTADGMTASVTFSSQDGTAQGGDGMAFVFTDGGIAPQGTAIGGFGNLGLQNWEGGYIAVVLDEYGQSCTCNHAAPPGNANAGPCGFCGNSISIQLAGTARQGASCACCTIASTSVAPNQINSTNRNAPGRLIVSIIEDGGQTFVSASVVWPGSTEPVVYFDRVRVDDCAGPAPASLRMALYGGSGGAFRSEHEFRDALATAAGQQNWRAFPIVTDAIDPCVTEVLVEACVDVTFVEDTQTVGNGNPEAFLWLVNSATNTIIDRVQRSSQPSQVGTTNTMCVSATVPVAQLPDLRVYVGAETRDANGLYGSTWENFEITATGVGCPVIPVRTIAISAPCPIDVNIVGGTADGTPAPVTVVNTPSTFEDAVVCITVAGDDFTGFRREIRDAEGNITITFLGLDGLPVTPDSWVAGSCNRDTEVVELCDVQGSGAVIPFLRVFTFDENGQVVAVTNQDGDGNPYTTTGSVSVCSNVDVIEHILCDANGEAFVRRSILNGGTLVSSGDVLLDGVTPFAPALPVGTCAADNVDREERMQGRLLNPGDTWTPVEVTGDLLSVTISVFSGVATVTDSSGDVIGPLPSGFTWSASAIYPEDTFAGPLAVSAVSGQVFVGWTEVGP